MKIWISNNNGKDLSSYKSLSIEAFLSGIDVPCEQGEAEKIVCHDLFSSINKSDVNFSLTHVASKVKIGGEIVIIEPDIIGILLSYYINKNITIDDVNRIIFEDGLAARSIIEAKEMEKILKELNFETSRNCQNGYITIKGTRK